MKTRTLLLGAGLCILLTLALHPVSLGCPVCYGDPDSSSAQGMNAAILSLLGVTGGVLGGFGSLFLRMRSKAKAIQREESHG
jgi:hypothetical protein